MEDQRARLEDLAERALRTGRPCVSGFMTAERVLPILPRGGAFRLMGGHPDPERVLCCALPEEGFRVREEDFLACVRIRPNDRKNYSHRDYLGSILALGIRRESVGDILIGEGEAFAVVGPPMAEFLRDNLVSVSRTGCTCTVIPTADIPELRREREELTVSVHSPRLDCILSAVYGVSRAEAKAMCERGLCSVNRLPAEKAEKLLAEGDLVVLRGRGRFRVGAQAGLSKKGRIRLSVSREL